MAANVATGGTSTGAGGSVHAPVDQWWVGEGETPFSYYLPGALALSFLFTFILTRGLRRTEPCVAEVSRDENEEVDNAEEEKFYIVIVTTSLLPGAGCPEEVKVLLQLRGSYIDSPFFIVKSNKSRKAVFQRGCTDIFLLRVTGSIGSVLSLRFVVSGLQSQLKWRIRSTELYEISSKKKKDVKAVVMTTEVLDDPDITSYVIKTATWCHRWLVLLVRYHQWLSLLGNPVRFGALTETVYHFLICTALTTVLTLSLALYIFLPHSDSVSFDLDPNSLWVASLTSAFGTFVLIFGLEVLLRNVRAREVMTGDTWRAYSKVQRSGRNMYAKSGRNSYLAQKSQKDLTYWFNLDETFGYKYDVLSGTVPSNSKDRTEELKELAETCRHLPSITEPIPSNLEVKPASSTELAEPGARSQGILSAKHFIMVDEPKRKPVASAGPVPLLVVPVDEEPAPSLQKRPATPRPDRKRPQSVTWDSEVPSQPDVDWEESRTTTTSGMPDDDLFGMTSGELLDMLKDREEKMEDAATGVSAATDSDMPLSQGIFIPRDVTLDKHLPEKYESSQKLEKFLLTTDISPEKYLAELETTKAGVEAEGKSPSQEKAVRPKTSLDMEQVFEQPKIVPKKVRARDKLARNLLRKRDVLPYDFVESMSRYGPKSTTGHPSRDRVPDGASSSNSGRKSAEMHAVFTLSLEASCQGTYRGTDEIEDSDSETQEQRNEQQVPRVSGTVVDDRQTQSGNILRDCNQWKDRSSNAVDHKKLHLEWQQSLRTWSRSFVRDIASTLRKYQHSGCRGSLTFSEGSVYILHWVHGVVSRICTSMVIRRRPFNKDVFQLDLYPEVVSLVFHLASEITLMSIQGVCRLLGMGDSSGSTLAELIIQSHLIMKGVERAANSVLYCAETLHKSYSDEKETRMFQYVDVDWDLKILARELMQECAGLSLKQVFLPWTLIQDLCEPQEEEDLEDLTQKLTALIILAAENETELEFEESNLVSRFCEHTISKAKQELWVEYHNDKIVYVDMLMKKEVLVQLSNMAMRLSKKNKKQREKLNEEKGEVEMTRGEMRRQRRQSLLEHVAAGTEKLDTIALALHNKQAAERLATQKAKHAVDKVAHELDVVTQVREELKKHWHKMGFQSSIKADMRLAQALIHPLVRDPLTGLGKGDGKATVTFDHILELKRKEAQLASWLVDIVSTAVGEFLPDICTRFMKIYARGRNKQDELGHNDVLRVVEEIMVQLDLKSVEMTKTVETIMWEVLKDVRDQPPHSEAMLKSAPASEQPSKSTAYKPSADIQSGEKESKTRSEHVSADTIRQGKKEKPPKMSKRDDKGEETTEASQTPGLQDLISDLQPMRDWLMTMKREEERRHKVTQKNYLERLLQQREYFCKVNLQNTIDSFYMVDDVVETKRLNKTTLYQIEHDVMGESQKPLPGFVKIVVMAFLFVFIVLSLCYVALVSGQLSIEEIQEWMCYFLLSLTLHAFLMEPLRAVLIGILVNKNLLHFSLGYGKVIKKQHIV